MNFIGNISVTYNPVWSVGGLLGGDVLVEAVEALWQGAVHVEPPVADKVLLVEQGAVGAEEAVLGEVAVPEVGAHMEGLTVGLGVSVVALDPAAAEEAGVGGEGEDGIVLARLPGDCLGQRGDGVQLLTQHQATGQRRHCHSWEDGTWSVQTWSPESRDRHLVLSSSWAHPDWAPGACFNYLYASEYQCIMRSPAPGAEWRVAAIVRVWGEECGETTMDTWTDTGTREMARILGGKGHTVHCSALTGYLPVVVVENKVTKPALGPTQFQQLKYLYCRVFNVDRRT